MEYRRKMMGKKGKKKEYLTFTALEAGTFTFTIYQTVTTDWCTSVSYSIDDGSTWVTTNNINNENVTITTPTISAGGTVKWKGIATKYADEFAAVRVSKFASTGNFNVSGNIMSMLYGANFSGSNSFSTLNVFSGLFTDCTHLISASELVLPANVLTKWCYHNMFKGCSSLTDAPALPAMGLYDYCYVGMFEGCSSLAIAPTLPATVMKPYCYNRMFLESGVSTPPSLSHVTQLEIYCFYNMFSGCTSLTVTPDLPTVSSIASGAFHSMFSSCTSLTAVPLTLPAVSINNESYRTMFFNCTSLRKAPAIAATTIGPNSMSGMFRNCTSLITAPATLPATTLKSSCYSNMFYGCTSLYRAPVLPATTLVSKCYEQMFYGCSNLSYIKAMFTTAPRTSYTSNWVRNVAKSGTYVKNSTATYTTTSTSAIPSGWTVTTASS